jgi:hypothetical protein
MKVIDYTLNVIMLLLERYKNCSRRNLLLETNFLPRASIQIGLMKKMTRLRYLDFVHLIFIEPSALKTHTPSSTPAVAENSDNS